MSEECKGELHRGGQDEPASQDIAQKDPSPKASSPQKGITFPAIMAVVCVFVLIFVPNYAQYQLSPLAFQIIPQFNMDAVGFSALFSAAMVTGIVLSPVSGLLCDKFGVKRMISIAAGITLFALVARIFVSDYASLFACMVLTGVTATFVNASIAKIMGSWFSGRYIGIAVGVGMSGSMMSMMVGMSTSTLFPSVNAIFVFTAVVAAVGAVLWIVGFKEPPVSVSTVGEGADATGQDASGAPSFSECIKAAVKSRNIWLIGLALAANMAAMMSVMSFMPQALVAVRGFDESVSGAITSVVTVGSFAGSLLAPILAARFSDQRYFLAVLSVIAGAGTAFGWLLPEGLPLSAGLFLTGFCTSGVMTVLLAIPVRLPEIGPKYAASAGGIAASMQLAGAVIVPTYILTPLFGGNFVAFYQAAGAICLVMAVCCLLLPRLREDS